MAVVIKKFCCCEGANLRLGSVVVGILSLMGSGFMLVLSILSVIYTNEEKSKLNTPNEVERFSNTTKEHWDNTVDLEYVSLTMDIISVIVAALLIYGAIKRIRPLLYTYIIWTIVIVLGSLSALVYFGLDGPHIIVAMYVFHFFLLLATAIYFILVVYSYSELIREGGDRQPVPLQGPGKDDQDIKFDTAVFAI